MPYPAASHLPLGEPEMQWIHVPFFSNVWRKFPILGIVKFDFASFHLIIGVIVTYGTDGYMVISHKGQSSQPFPCSQFALDL